MQARTSSYGFTRAPLAAIERSKLPGSVIEPKIMRRRMLSH
jgi:hypothetical protein